MPLPLRRKPTGGKCADATWRHERAVKAGRAAAAAYLARALERGPDYVRGYREGYRRAYRAWKARYDRLLARVR